MIRIEIDFLDKGKFEDLIRYIEDNLVYAEAQEQIRIVGHHLADNMRDIITSERKRPDKGTHNLENAITAETISTTAGVEVGVGRISELKMRAPYFEMLNDGATYTTKIQHVVPFEDGEFRTYTVGSSHTIAGISYVQRAIKNLDAELKQMVEKLGSSWLDGMSGGGHQHGWGMGAGGAK